MRDIRSRESGASSSQTGISLLDVEGGNSPGYSAKNYAGNKTQNPMASMSGAALLGTLGLGPGSTSGAGGQQAFNAHVERLALLLKRHLAGSNTSNAARAALLASWPDPSSADASERAPAPVRLESRLKKKPPRGADPKRVSRDERRVSWDVPPAAPRAPAATPRTEPKPRRRTEKTMRAPRLAGF